MTVKNNKLLSSNRMHYDKNSEPDHGLSIAGSTLKWYNLAKLNEPVPPTVQDLAVSFLRREAGANELDSLGELGFAILHRCGDDFYFLLVGTWKNGNELWESVYAKTSDNDHDFSVFPLTGTHRATFCVWELAIVWHEQQAWKRFLMSSGDGVAQTAYLGDQYRGIA